jgi:hypothetical protein
MPNIGALHIYRYLCGNAMWLYKKQAVRLISLLLAAAFLAVLIFASSYISGHATHIHDHDAPDGGCIVCVRVRLAEGFLQQLSFAFAVAVIVSMHCLFLTHIARATDKYLSGSTLVNQRIRLNN